MKIEINEEWRVTSDKYQFILERRTGDKKPRWEADSYSDSLSHLMSILVRKAVRGAEVDTFREVLEKVENLSCDISRALTGYFEVDIRVNGEKPERVVL